MNNSSVKAQLDNIFAKDQILTDEPMKNHTTFKIGGPADFMLLPADPMQISRVIKEITGVPVFVMGNGSNLLVKDSGIRGVVIKISNNMNTISAQDNVLSCQSGALLSAIASVALKHSLGGFEFAAGIPGTLGGAVVMNAGAYDGEMKDVVVSTTYIDENGDLCETAEHSFGYRKSVFSGKKWIVTGAKIRLFQKDESAIQERMRCLSQCRRDKQPLECASAGSTFKRPEGYFAGKLIDDAGLRGHRIGGAQVSEKHCGFIINDGTATFDDVASLIRYVQDTVYQKFGVWLETEVKICGS